MKTKCECVETVASVADSSAFPELTKHAREYCDGNIVLTSIYSNQSLTGFASGTSIDTDTSAYRKCLPRLTGLSEPSLAAPAINV